jgi:hypothetical protein
MSTSLTRRSFTGSLVLAALTIGASWQGHTSHHLQHPPGL